MLSETLAGAHSQALRRVGRSKADWTPGRGGAARYGPGAGRARLPFPFSDLVTWCKAKQQPATYRDTWMVMRNRALFRCQNKLSVAIVLRVDLLGRGAVRFKGKQSCSAMKRPAGSLPRSGETRAKVKLGQQEAAGGPVSLKRSRGNQKSVKL